MKRAGLRCSLIAFAVVMLAGTPSCFAQLGQIGGGTGGTTGGAGGGATTGGGAAGGGAGTQGAAQAGGTTAQGLGGLTTQGPGGSGLQGGVAGANTSTVFVGGNNNGGFVGGAVATQNNNNRQFRAITNTAVPTGGNQQQTSGTPRQIPTVLRVAFSIPQLTSPASQFGTSSQTITNVAEVKPELRAVTISVNPDGTAILTGVVSSHESRRLAANLVRFNPGVRQVKNDIVVAGP